MPIDAPGSEKFHRLVRNLLPRRGIEHPPGGSLLGVLTACAALVACTRPDLRLPAITVRSSAEHHVGKVIWLDCRGHA
jgi:hypothetical protein